MTGNLLIKVCGILHVGNRQLLESLPIDLFGFIFHPPSPRYAGNLSTGELAALTNTSKSRAGVFVNATVNEMLERARQANLTHLQLHGEETTGSCLELKQEGYTVIKAFGLHDAFQFETLEAYCGVVDYFLFDTQSAQKGGTGQKFNWKLLEAYPFEVPYFLSGGIGPGDAVNIGSLSHKAFRGIDLNSRFEDAPGLKNHRALHEFLNQLISIL